jgi:hypothetical protein
MILADYSNPETGYAYPSVSILSVKCCMKERNAQKILSNLGKGGVLEIIPKKDARGLCLPNFYRIIEGGRVSPSAPIGVSPSAPKPQGLTESESINPELFEKSSINKPKPEADLIKEVWNYYLETIEKSPLTKLTPKRQKMALLRYQEVLKAVPNPVPELAVALLKECIDELAASDYHMARGKYAGQPKYNSWEILFRSQEQFEKWTSRVYEK